MEARPPHQLFPPPPALEMLSPAPEQEPTAIPPFPRVPQQGKVPAPPPSVVKGSKAARSQAGSCLLFPREGL